MADLAADLPDAARDFRHLLARGYPRAASLTLVGNRYGLNYEQRHLLHRGVFAPSVALARRRKLRLLRDLAGRALAVDGHNVLITLEAALRGLPLVAADDGFVRDVARLSRAYRASTCTETALSLLAGHLRAAAAGPLSFWFDAPMSKSGELAKQTAALCRAHGLTAAAQAVPVPERELLACAGPIATSDTHLIDAKDEVVDLAGEIIRSEPRLRPALIALS